ncbi:MAG: hypothetical protein IT279_10345 [Ignavibacteriaceae bacterium]|nr:hypothetical protein [Ignavibacteriaceae bacterium]
MQFRHISILFLLIQLILPAQSYNSIKEKAEDYFLSLASNEKTADTKLDELDKLLKTLSTVQDESQKVDSLIRELNEHQRVSRIISTDSSLVLFNLWYMKFSAMFYHTGYEEFFNHSGTKIILFSASVSCPCTMEMARNQSIDIIAFGKKHNIYYWIIDSFDNCDLQIFYDALFTPTVLIFDKENRLVHKIVYDENMKTLLEEYIKSHL